MTFTAPIGTEEERATGMIWPGRWFDATGYDHLYELGYHTGADLNLNFPFFDANAHSSVVAIGDGKVIYAQRFPNPRAWGNIIVIDHDIVDGKPLLSRYAHVENIMVAVGDSVSAGTPIADVGNGDGLFPYHLHFDISQTDKLCKSPGDWPGSNQASVLANYTNPQEWLQVHVTGGVGNMNTQLAQLYYVTATLGLRVREDHKTSARQIGALTFRSRVYLKDTETVNEDSFKWGRISSGIYSGDWIAMGKDDQSDTFVSRFSPTA